MTTGAWRHGRALPSFGADCGRPAVAAPGRAGGSGCAARNPPDATPHPPPNFPSTALLAKREALALRRLGRAAKVARRFERQKVARRLKAAADGGQPTGRLQDQLAAVEGMDVIDLVRKAGGGGGGGGWG